MYREGTRWRKINKDGYCFGHKSYIHVIQYFCIVLIFHREVSITELK